jgi:septal ring factor EnvC (AmiA/AmiB activator)
MTYLLLTLVLVLLTAFFGYKSGDPFKEKAVAMAYKGFCAVSLLSSLALILLQYKVDKEVFTMYKQAIADSGKALDEAQRAGDKVEKTVRAAKTGSDALLSKLEDMRQKEALIQAQLKQHNLFADYQNGVLRPANKSSSGVVSP